MSELWDAKVEEWGSQDEGTSHCPEPAGSVLLLRNEGDQGDKGDEGEGLDGADEALEHGLGVGGKEGVRQLARQALQAKLDCKDVDGEDGDSHNLVSLGGEIFMKGAKRKEAAKESKAEGCGEEAETEEETNTELF